MTERKKSHWGTGIVIAIAVFITVMLGVAGYLMTQDVNLVTDRYYEKELAYQDRIHALERTRALGASAGIAAEEGRLVVWFPRSVSGTAVDGQVLLYRPADRAADRTVAVAPDSTGRQVVPTAHLLSGLWRAQVQWRAGGHDYYMEQPFMVP